MSLGLELRQASLPGLCPVADAVESLAGMGGEEQRGAVFTRREVVDFVLDLVGYTTNRPLHRLSLLEPSFGGGDFLLPAIKRLLLAWKSAKPEASPLEALKGCIRAVELHGETFDRTCVAVIDCLVEEGIGADDARAISAHWLLRGDFLLSSFPEPFDLVVGNPPYVRQELIPEALLREYRSRYTTMYDRADLYVAFIERSLLLLRAGGALGFICADRWMKNRYGGPLRALVARDFHLKIHIDMSNTSAFHSDVVAYPAITVISREKPGVTRLAFRPAIEASVLSALAADLTAETLQQGQVRELADVASGSEPWIFDSAEQLAIVRRLERDFPLLEDTGCKVGIGVATGADQAFIGPMESLDVEEDRKLPLVMTRDIADGTVQWRGLGVINPFADDGGLVDLARYPRLERYLVARKTQIAGRHCALRDQTKWYRTIDRITPSLAMKPKLLLPDIKGSAHVVYEDGHLYPHHNLYFVTADTWDLHALQAVLLSNVARLFVTSYSTRMRGGFLRFQAQYLRRIRLPQWSEVTAELRNSLSEAAKVKDLAACNHAAIKLYGLTPDEADLLEQVA